MYFLNIHRTNTINTIKKHGVVELCINGSEEII
jgi:hypothetical protein